MTETITKNKKKLAKLPNKFHVLLLNDDYTTMEFVVEVLVRFFRRALTKLII